MKEHILKMLQEPDFVSGQMISERLGISRTAVWKYINSLKKDGYEIESVTRKGYRLLHSPDLLTTEGLCVRLSSDVVSGEIRCYLTIDSTNEEAKRRAGQGGPDRSLYVAEIQTRGKGRRGRIWNSPGGDDLFFSLLLRPDIPVECASMITLVAAYGVLLTIDGFIPDRCQIKWPNDIVLHKKKICGILTEMSTEMDQIQYLVVGIGINVNRTDFDPDIKEIAGSIFSETGERISRLEFLGEFTRNFFRLYERFTEVQDLSFLMEEYNARLINVGREVRIIGGRKDETRGKALGIDQEGELLVEDAGGAVRTIRSGEVSVRGLYGYV